MARRKQIIPQHEYVNAREFTKVIETKVIRSYYRLKVFGKIRELDWEKDQLLILKLLAENSPLLELGEAVEITVTKYVRRK